MFLHYNLYVLQKIYLEYNIFRTHYPELYGLRGKPFQGNQEELIWLLAAHFLMPLIFVKNILLFVLVLENSVSRDILLCVIDFEQG